MATLCMELRQVWNYRRFILGAVAREFKSRFNRSVLGVLWLLAAPFAMITIYVVVFSHVMQARVPGSGDIYAYSVFICAGMLPWQWFAELLSRNTGVFVDNAGLVKKNNFPRLVLPTINLFASGFNYFLASAIFFTFLIATGTWPGLVVLMIIPLLLLQSLFASALGFLLGVINVFFRDVGNAVGLVLQFWFWLTPIVYAADALPKNLKTYLSFNPMLPIIRGYQDIFLHRAMPDFSSYVPILVLTLLLTLLAYQAYQKASPQITDEL